MGWSVLTLSTMTRLISESLQSMSRDVCSPVGYLTCAVKMSCVGWSELTLAVNLSNCLSSLGLTDIERAERPAAAAST